MGFRRTVSRSLDRVAGQERTAGVRRLEARARARLIDALDVEGSRVDREEAGAARRDAVRTAVAAERAAAAKRAAKRRAAAEAKRKAAAEARWRAQHPTREELIEAHGRTREGISHKAAGALPWASADPWAEFPEPEGTRHSLLAGLHEQLQPRRYFEIGVDRGQSMTLSRTRSIGVDPAFTIDRELDCDVRIVKDTSDNFFASPDAFARFEGVPVDLAFIDGMHLAEFALRDFMNVEKHMSRAGVVILDDMLPRNALEAYRIRRTTDWTGDVYKIHQVLGQYRPDLTIVPINVLPTGSYMIVGLDPDSTVLDDHYAEIEPTLLAPDPQEVPQEWLERRTAVHVDSVLGAGVWKQLVDLRDPEPSREQLAPLWDELRSLPTIWK